MIALKYCRYSDELYHHGIKGQKWGVRRFQNLDRTWTEAGKIRYGKGTGRRRASPQDDKEQIRYKGSSKSELSIDELRNKNSKSEAYMLATSIILNAASLNPVGLAKDTVRVGKYISAKYKNAKFQSERMNSPIDEKTGFHMKTKETSPEEDLKRVNPNYNDFNSNSKQNCMLCTSTYELRRRGYDVTANKASYGYNLSDVRRWFPKSKYIEYKNENINKTTNALLDLGIKANMKYVTDTVKKIEESQPNGSRGNLTVRFDARGSGHSMAYEIRNNKLVILDAQTNKVYKNPVSALSNCFAIGITRLDNVDFDPKAIKECCA